MEIHNRTFPTGNVATLKSSLGKAKHQFRYSSFQSTRKVQAWIIRNMKIEKYCATFLFLQSAFLAASIAAKNEEDNKSELSTASTTAVSITIEIGELPDFSVELVSFRGLHVLYFERVVREVCHE